MKKGIFFDLDGTLWSALEPLVDSYNKTLKDNNLPYRFNVNDLKSIMGLTPKETVKILFKDKDEQEGLKVFKLLHDNQLIYLSTHPGKLYYGVIDTLKILKDKYPLYIVSNADKGYIENFINSLNMKEYFIDYVQAGDTNFAKWENILYLKNKHNIDDVIYVGDTLKDKIESNKANVKFIFASYGFGVIENEVNKINSFIELPSLIDKLFSL